MNNKKAFTLIEMVLVLIIVAALLLIVIPNMSTQADSAKKTTDEALIKNVETQMELYKLAKNKSSATLEELESDGYLEGEQVDAYEAASSSKAAAGTTTE
ncbi:prepilin-type N-terminal cleavage/methylation domain-containing protein [Aerococcus agrisoli]|uniref:Prepilin-type N-terminal cleavage/methylation domain-containing protein n=2 Tax=Aerococcus agrisoli TaxID=2487350 RepID=A0A3N4H4X5_9LACT|nr:prepilin-type N-terminal cleavage/methylation domain-containing protein [Aerococcus agrisoli]